MILLLAIFGGCAAKPYHQLLDVGEAQARPLAVAQAECEMVRLGYQTSPKRGEYAAANDPSKQFQNSMDGLVVALQAKKMYRLCMRTKGWQQ